MNPSHHHVSSNVATHRLADPKAPDMNMTSDARHVSHHEAVRGAAAIRGEIQSEFLTFRIGAEEYGIDILRVQEIRSYEPPTRIANAPPFIKGVINLRGVIVPIVDMRLKLGCDSAEYNHFTVVIVLNLRGRMVGAVVDSVSDVLALAQDSIKPAPEISSAVDIGFITGIASLAGRMLILLDIEGLMSSPEMGLVNSAA